MATCSYVGILKDGKFHYIYNNFDSDIDDLGVWLYNNIQDVSQIQAILDRGDASSIQADKFYREMGESGDYLNEDVADFTPEFIWKCSNDVSFIYLFDQDKENWYVIDFSEKNMRYTPIDLKTAIQKHLETRNSDSWYSEE